MARLGLGDAWRCQWANDFDPAKAEVYASWFDDAGEHLLVDDVARVTSGELTAAAAAAGEPTRLAWASFPCQDLSLAGWGRGMSSRRSGSFWAFWRLMHELLDADRRPPIIVLENVVGLLRPEEFSGLAEAMADLDMALGALVIDAVRFVPQSRPRVFVVAVDRRLDPGPWTSPEPQAWWTTQALLRTHAALPAAVRERWLWWRLPPPPDPGDRPALADLIDPDPPDARWHTEAETAYLISLMDDLHLRRLSEVQAHFQADPTAAAAQPVGTLYKRTRKGRQRAEIRFDGVAGCLRTPQGGSSRQTLIDLRSAEGRPGPTGQPRTRLVTARETARLMGVPDSQPLPERYNQAYKAMGDGVAVPAVAHLSTHLLTPLADAIDAGDSLVNAQSIPPRAAADAAAARSRARAEAWAQLAVDDA